MDISLGTWQIAPSDGFWTNQNKATSEEVVSTAVRLGIRHFDTAQSYGKGQSEQVLSKVLSRYPNEGFSIDTKIMPSTKAVSDIVKISQTRLKGLSINCLYLHWPRSGFDNRSMLDDMCRLRESGVIQKVGVCNMPLKDLDSILKSGLKIDRYQRPLSLLWMRDLHETQALCSQYHMELVVYSPMGMGLLSGKYRQSSDLVDARAKSFCFDSRCNSQYLNLLNVISEVAQHNGRSMSDVALTWTVSKSPDVLLLGARNVQQLKENLHSLELTLSQQELDMLSASAEELEKASMGVCDNIFSYHW